MAKNKDTEKKEEATADIPMKWAERVTGWAKAEEQAWRETHYNFYKYQNFEAGNHYTYIDTASGAPKNLNQGVTVDLASSIIRGITNNIIKLHPKWNFAPQTKSTGADHEVLKLAKLMDKLYDELDMKRIGREIIKTGLTLSAAPLFVGWDTEKNNGKGGIVLRAEDNFLLMPDHGATDVSNAKYFIRKIKQRLADVQNNPKYEYTEKLKPQKELGATPIHKTVLEVTQKISDTQRDLGNEYGDVWITECYVKEWVDEGYKNFLEEDKTRKVPKIRLICECQGNVLYNELTDMEDYPFVYYFSDKGSFSFYGKGWMKSLIPLNQTINKLCTQELEYIDKSAKFVVLKPKGSKTEYIKGTNYDEITYDKTLNPEGITQLKMQGLPSDLQHLKQSMQEYLKTIGGYADVMQGVAPGANVSNAAIETLIEAGGNTTIEAKENYQTFLEQVTRLILWNVAKYKMASETLMVSGDKGEQEQLEYISQLSPTNMVTNDNNGADPTDILRIATENNVRVSIESDTADTKQGRLETAKMLYSLVDPVTQQPLLPAKSVLDIVKFGNIKEILEEREIEMQQKEAQKMAENAEVQKMQEQMKEMQSQYEGQIQELEQKLDYADDIRKQINYRDAPEDIKRQLEEQAGMTPSQEVTTDPNSINPLDDYGQQVNLRKQMSEKLVEAVAKQSAMPVKEESGLTT